MCNNFANGALPTKILTTNFSGKKLLLDSVFLDIELRQPEYLVPLKTICGPQAGPCACLGYFLPHIDSKNQVSMFTGYEIQILLPTASSESWHPVHRQHLDDRVCCAQAYARRELCSEAYASSGPSSTQPSVVYDGILVLTFEGRICLLQWNISVQRFTRYIYFGSLWFTPVKKPLHCALLHFNNFINNGAASQAKPDDFSEILNTLCSNSHTCGFAFDDPERVLLYANPLCGSSKENHRALLCCERKRLKIPYFVAVLTALDAVIIFDASSDVQPVKSSDATVVSFLKQNCLTGDALTSAKFKRKLYDLMAQKTNNLKVNGPHRTTEYALSDATELLWCGEGDLTKQTELSSRSENNAQDEADQFALGLRMGPSLTGITAVCLGKPVALQWLPGHQEDPKLGYVTMLAVLSFTASRCDKKKAYVSLYAIPWNKSVWTGGASFSEAPFSLANLYPALCLPIAHLEVVNDVSILTVIPSVRGSFVVMGLRSIMACQWSSGKISILHVLPLVWDDKMQNAYSLCSNFVKTTDLNGAKELCDAFATPSSHNSGALGICVKVKYTEGEFFFPSDVVQQAEAKPETFLAVLASLKFHEVSLFKRISTNPVRSVCYDGALESCLWLDGLLSKELETKSKNTSASSTDAENRWLLTFCRTERTLFPLLFHFVISPGLDTKSRGTPPTVNVIFQRLKCFFFDKQVSRLPVCVGLETHTRDECLKKYPESAVVPLKLGQTSDSSKQYYDIMIPRLRFALVCQISLDLSNATAEVRCRAMLLHIPSCGFAVSFVNSFPIRPQGCTEDMKKIEGVGTNRTPCLLALSHQQRSFFEIERQVPGQFYATLLSPCEYRLTQPAIIKLGAGVEPYGCSRTLFIENFWLFNLSKPINDTGTTLAQDPDSNPMFLCITSLNYTAGFYCSFNVLLSQCRSTPSDKSGPFLPGFPFHCDFSVRSLAVGLTWHNGVPHLVQVTQEAIFIDALKTPDHISSASASSDTNTIVRKITAASFSASEEDAASLVIVAGSVTADVNVIVLLSNQELIYLPLRYLIESDPSSRAQFVSGITIKGFRVQFETRIGSCLYSTERIIAVGFDDGTVWLRNVETTACAVARIDPQRITDHLICLAVSHDGTVLLRGAVNGLLSIDVYQQCTMDDVGHWWTQRRHLGSGSPIEQITVFQDEGLPSIGRGKAGEKTFRFIVRTDALFIVTVTVGVSVSITVENVFLEQPHPVRFTAISVAFHSNREPSMLVAVLQGPSCITFGRFEKDPWTEHFTKRYLPIPLLKSPEAVVRPQLSSRLVFFIDKAEPPESIDYIRTTTVPRLTMCYMEPTFSCGPETPVTALNIRRATVVFRFTIEAGYFQALKYRKRSSGNNTFHPSKSSRAWEFELDAEQPFYLTERHYFPSDPTAHQEPTDYGSTCREEAACLAMWNLPKTIRQQLERCEQKSDDVGAVYHCSSDALVVLGITVKGLRSLDASQQPHGGDCAFDKAPTLLFFRYNTQFLKRRADLPRRKRGKPSQPLLQGVVKWMDLPRQTGVAEEQQCYSRLSTMPRSWAQMDGKETIEDKLQRIWDAEGCPGSVFYAPNDTRVELLTYWVSRTIDSPGTVFIYVRAKNAPWITGWLPMRYVFIYTTTNNNSVWPLEEEDLERCCPADFLFYKLLCRFDLKSPATCFAATPCGRYLSVGTDYGVLSFTVQKKKPNYKGIYRTVETRPVVSRLQGLVFNHTMPILTMQWGTIPSSVSASSSSYVLIVITSRREVYILYPPSVVGKKLCNNEFGLKPVSWCLLRKKVSLVACTASCLWVQHSTASFMRWEKIGHFREPLKILPDAGTRSFGSSCCTLVGTDGGLYRAAVLETTTMQTPLLNALLLLYQIQALLWGLSLGVWYTPLSCVVYHAVFGTERNDETRVVAFDGPKRLLECILEHFFSSHAASSRCSQVVSKRGRSASGSYHCFRSFTKEERGQKKRASSCTIPQRPQCSDILESSDDSLTTPVKRAETSHLFYTEAEKKLAEAWLESLERRHMLLAVIRTAVLLDPSRWEKLRQEVSPTNGLPFSKGVPRLRDDDRFIWKSDGALFDVRYKGDPGSRNVCRSVKDVDLKLTAILPFFGYTVPVIRYATPHIIEMNFITSLRALSPLALRELEELIRLTTVKQSSDEKWPSPFSLYEIKFALEVLDTWWRTDCT